MKGELGLMLMMFLVILSAMFCLITMVAYTHYEESCELECYEDCGNGIKKVWEWLEFCDDE